MMIDRDSEDVVRLDGSRHFFPSRPALGTLYRWAHEGFEGHILETIRVGQKLFTSKEAVDRFLAAINEPKSNPAKVSAKRREKQNAAAKRELEKLGAC